MDMELPVHEGEDHHSALTTGRRGATGRVANAWSMASSRAEGMDLGEGGELLETEEQANE